MSIKHQIITEKAHKLLEQGIYVFCVDKKSKKDDIAKNIESVFSVKVENVRVANMPKKFKSFRGTKGFESSYKKAYVKLLPGMKIDFENLDKEIEKFAKN
jgi:large subunit ribosomal protein L23